MFWKLIMKLFGWKISEDFPKDIKRCVLIAVPHTSNWDFLFTIATFRILGIKIRFTIKDFWVKFPFGLISIPLGAISIDRSKKVPGEKRESMVEAMTNLFKENEDLVLLVTAEGTRKKVENWKSGFYYVAKNANVPIVIGTLNYKTKVAGIEPEFFYPTDDIEKDMKIIMDKCKNLEPKHPERFSTDKRYD